MTSSGLPRIEVRADPADAIELPSFYEILRLRTEVLIVEQRVPYMDLDGRDLLPETVHIWAYSQYPVALGSLRLVRNDDGELQLGRLCTSRRARGRGVARRLVTRAMDFCADEEVVTHVHSHLAPWYESFGFRSTATMFHELGIPHVPMRRRPPEIELS